MSCLCKCHVGGPLTSCDLGPIQPGGQRSCIVVHAADDAPKPAEDIPADIPPEQRCVLGHNEPAKRYIGLLCTRHYHWCYNTLDEISQLYALLPEVILPGPSGQERHGTSVEAPAPGRLDVMAITEMRDDLRSTRDPGDELWFEGCADIPKLIPALQSWISTIVEEREIQPPESPWVQRRERWVLPDTLAECVRILRREQRWISRQLWVDDYMAELGKLHRALATAVGDTMWPKPLGKCPNCAASLYPTVGVDQVSCSKCGSVWAGKSLIRLRLILEQDEEAKRARSSRSEPSPTAAGG